MQYLKRPFTVGAVMPSSRWLATRMISGIDFSSVETIAEFGTGTGSITDCILKHKQPRTKLFAFETNPDFIPLLSARYTDEQMCLIHKPAEDMLSSLKTYGISHIDAIVSSLPLAAWENDKRREILRTAREALWRGGVYTQFQYIGVSNPLRTYSLFNEIFSSVHVSTVLMNIPPAFAYTCVR